MKTFDTFQTVVRGAQGASFETAKKLAFKLAGKEGDFIEPERIAWV